MIDRSAETQFDHLLDPGLELRLSSHEEALLASDVEERSKALPSPPRAAERFLKAVPTSVTALAGSRPISLSAFW